VAAAADAAGFAAELLAPAGGLDAGAVLAGAAAPPQPASRKARPSMPRTGVRVTAVSSGESGTHHTARLTAARGLALGQRQHVSQLLFGHAYPLALVAAELELGDLLLRPVPRPRHVLVRVDDLQRGVVAALLRLPEVDVLDDVVLLIQGDGAFHGFDLQAVESVQEALLVLDVAVYGLDGRLEVLACRPAHAGVRRDRPVGVLGVPGLQQSLVGRRLQGRRVGVVAGEAGH